MENIKIEVKETKMYWQRVVASYLPKILAALVLYIIMLTVIISRNHELMSKQYLIALALAFFIPLIPMMLISDMQTSCFIRLFEVRDGYLNIEYTKRGKLIVVKDKTGNFAFKIGVGQNWVRYLTIYSKWNGEILSQFQNQNWRKEYSELIHYLQNNVKIAIPWYQRMLYSHDEYDYTL